MIEAIAIGPADIAAALDPAESAAPAETVVSRWTFSAEDLRFFVTCYLAGLIVFLVMLS